MEKWDRAWLAYLASSAAAFGYLERDAYGNREPDKPSGTLTATTRRWLGLDPQHWRRRISVPVFTAFVVLLWSHFIRGKP